MAEVLVAEKAGACYGVERALKMVREAAHDHPGEVRTLGPLIHNPLVVTQLEREGVSVSARPEDAGGRVLLLRTHGVTPGEEARAREACALVLDATCPFVKRAHNGAELLVREGYQVIIVGETGHPEVEGTLGHAPDATVVANAAELEALEVGRRVGLVVQTTMTRAVLEEVVCALLGRCEELRVIDTICEATRERQEAAARLAASSDVMVVIGGKNSANTTHLAEICRASCPATHHVESPDEIDAAWLEGAARIGITAGASTPQDQIDEIRSRIAELLC